jgi:hypothetical protein
LADVCGQARSQGDHRQRLTSGDEFGAPAYRLQTPLLKCLAAQIAPFQDRNVEEVIKERGPGGAVILERVEGRLAVVVHGYDLSIDDRIVRQTGQRRRDGGIPLTEVILVPRPQLNFALRFGRDRALAISVFTQLLCILASERIRRSLSWEPMALPICS